MRSKISDFQKDYIIDKQCTGCGACKVVCPKHCISKGAPYIIHQDRCIRCGLCVKRCWRRVINLK
ncbi:MAG: 4Fe-4S binding protein [Cellulosilyticaceae bacterium]